jgi:hypothetical protein
VAVPKSLHLLERREHCSLLCHLQELSNLEKASGKNWACVAFKEQLKASLSHTTRNFLPIELLTFNTIVISIIAENVNFLVIGGWE